MIEFLCDIVGGEGEVRFDMISAEAVKIEGGV